MDIYFERIKPLFDDSGMTVKEIAAAIGCSYRDIYHWNTDGLKSYMKYLYQISDLFHVSVAYLKGETDIKNPATIYGGKEVQLIQLFRQLPEEQQTFVIQQLQGLLRGQ